MEGDSEWVEPLTKVKFPHFGILGPLCIAEYLKFWKENILKLKTKSSRFGTHGVSYKSSSVNHCHKWEQVDKTNFAKNYFYVLAKLAKSFFAKTAPTIFTSAPSGLKV